MTYGPNIWGALIQARQDLQSGRPFTNPAGLAEAVLLTAGLPSFPRPTPRLDERRARLALLSHRLDRTP